MGENLPETPAAGNDPAAPDAASATAAAPLVTEPDAKSSDDSGFSSSKPILMVGAAGDDVAELGYLLAAHGFPNAVSEGTAEAPPILDDALMRAVVEFQQANGINLFAPIGGEGLPVLREGVHTGAVDAHTWAALLGYQPKVVPAGAKA
jgi:peptidoglycan hydrolase-like protein with peptidoglycan-binding domain